MSSAFAWQFSLDLPAQRLVFLMMKHVYCMVFFTRFLSIRTQSKGSPRAQTEDD